MQPKQTVSFDSLAVSLRDAAAQQNPANRPLEFTNDAMLSASAHQQSLNVFGNLCIGRIVCSMPRFNWYRVSLENGIPDFPCCRGFNDTGSNVMGVRDMSVIPPDNDVVIYRHPSLNYGIILCTLPSIVQDGSLTFADWQFQGNNAGVAKNSYLSDYLGILFEDGGVIDFNNGSPLDATLFDWGRKSDLGGQTLMTPFMQKVTVDDRTGFWAFMDGLARLSGKDLEFRADGMESWYKHVNGELQGYRGESLYPWEAFGAYAHGTETFRTFTPKETQYDKSVGAIEPKEPDQYPVHRYREYSGYLGQGRIRQMVTKHPDSGDLNTLSAGKPPVTLFHEQILPNGAYVLGAQSVTIAKRTILPSPRIKRLPEDLQSDSANTDNYKFSNQFGSGSEHKVKNLSRDTLQSIESLGVSAILQDLDSYIFNWQGVTGFHYHDKDYELPEEQESPLERLRESVNFDELKSSYALSKPTPKEIEVDERYGNIKLTALLSKIHLDEDGSIVIGDGNSGQIVLAGGNVFIRCPGDVTLQPGRNLISMAGDDTVLRSVNSIDISAAKKDVRIKSEKNLQIVAANSGDGVFLLETKATSKDQSFEGKFGEDVSGGGLILKAAKSGIYNIAGEIYLRTGSVSGEVDSGEIILDADKGDANIRTICNSFERRIKTNLKDIFGISQITAVNQWEASEASLATAIKLTAGLSVFGSGITVQGSLEVTGGLISGDRADGRVNTLSEIRKAVINNRADLAESQANEREITEKGNYDDLFENQRYSVGINSPKGQLNAAFSYRTMSQYNTADYKVVEAEWQQLQRLAGGGGTKWVEPVVKCQGLEMMPYPGVEKWRDEQVYYTVDLTLFDVDTGCSKDRGELYENVTLATPQPTSAQSGYTIMS